MEKRKVYFIVHSIHYLNRLSGGGIASSSNLKNLRHIFGTGNVQPLSNSPKVKYNKLISVLLKCFKGVYFLLTSRFLMHWKAIRATKNRLLGDILFIDYSRYGSLATLSKRRNPNRLVVTHFHNIEVDFADAEIKNGSAAFWIRLVYKKHRNDIERQERQAVLHSDAVMFVNSRDLEIAKKRYGPLPYSVVTHIPVQDVWSVSRVVKSVRQHPKLLFVGINYGTNVTGINWFISNVIPHVTASLSVVGKGLRKKDILSHERVDFVGFVESLAPYYYDADIVVCPLFSEEGRKVKIVEALMYGKNILATKQAFSGYDEIDYQKIGGRCDSAKDFIDQINQYASDGSLHANRHNAYARSVFEKKYTQQASMEIMKKMFQHIMDKKTA